MSRVTAAWLNACEIHKEAWFGLIGLSIGPFVGSVESFRYLRTMENDLEATSGTIMCAIGGASAIILTFPWLIISLPIVIVGSVILITTTPLTFVFKLIIK